MENFKLVFHFAKLRKFPLCKFLVNVRRISIEQIALKLIKFKLTETNCNSCLMQNLINIAKLSLSRYRYEFVTDKFIGFLFILFSLSYIEYHEY